MLFNSWEFLILLIGTLCLYYLPLPNRRLWQVTLLLLASAIFYAWSEPRLLILLAISCLGNSIATERILHWKHVRNNLNRGRRWLHWSVALNLLLLAFFKYGGFLAGLLPVGWIGDEVQASLKSVPLPVGISFYTFQGISLLIDVWRNDLEPKQIERLSARSLGRLSAARDLSFYISFFPQLVAGPIVKAREFVGQIGAKQAGNVLWGAAFKSLILGYFLKLVVADNLAEQTIVLTQPWMVSLGPIDLLCLLYGYSFQIFADFAGYSLIAIGLGALFGYRLPINFNFPYLSTSVTEFWRRWHLSLSSWLRDYLYIPLGGNRKGPVRTYINLFLVMFLGGLWHGAAWKFALWGSLHGLFLALERLFSRRRKPASNAPIPVWKALLGWIYAFHVATFLWLTFLMPDIGQVFLFFKELVIPQQWHGPTVFVPILFGGFVVLYHVIAWISEHKVAWIQRLQGGLIEGAVYGGMLFFIFTNPGPPQGFIYFQF